MAPAIVGVINAPSGEIAPSCLSCLGPLAVSALECKSCKGLVHLRCSEMPDYSLVRLAITQASYECLICVKTKELDEDRYAAELTKVQELIAKEKSIIEQQKDQDDYQDAQDNIQEREADENINSGEIRSYEQNKKKVPICKYYQKRECKHGRNGNGCKFKHPKICQKFAKNGDRRGGCTSERNCKEYHPKACYESLETKECSRLRCRFFHLNNTKLTYEEKQIENLHHPISSQGRFERSQPISNLKRNQAGQYQGGNPPEDRVENESWPNPNREIFRDSQMNQKFLLIDRMQRLETMLGAIMQSVRPPNLTSRLPTHQ